MFDKEKYSNITWKNTDRLFWLCFPLVFINELLLGQRYPKVMLKDKEKGKVRAERYVVPCPHCGTIHNYSTWTYPNKTVFGNWYGLFCPNCGQIIPSLRNVFSLVILVCTYPLWCWFYKPLKKRWLAKQPERYKNVLTDISPQKAKKVWRNIGLCFGLVMFIYTIVFNLFLYKQITITDIIINVIVWIAMGLLWGYFMRK
jgi:tetrahydromethanopterin S-methyltransferase subunit G/predicted RNA-binding Zn-ribbon protein involved in translation (DUF1610 family)